MGSSEVIAALQRRYRTFFEGRTPVSFAVAMPDGGTHVLGPDQPVFTIIVKDARGARALAKLDRFGVAVSYLKGWLDLDGDLGKALTMRHFLRDFHPIAWISEFLPALLRGRAHDRESISHHYDEDSEFFLTFLDLRHRCYTEGIFARDDEPLEDAMTRKMDLALAALNVGPGDHVLEVGSGWGAFLQHAARRGVRVTALTLSAESERFLRELIEKEDLPATVVRQHFLGYETSERFDAIVNMGVTEHLPNYRASLRQYATLLKPGGNVYLDALAMRQKRKVSTFMKRYVYPGSSAPLLLHDYLRHVAKSPFQLLSVTDDRHNYYLTCREWAQRLDAAREDIVRRWGEPIYRRFRLFLWGSAAGFDTGLVQAYRWVLHLPPAPIPL